MIATLAAIAPRLLLPSLLALTLIGAVRAVLGGLYHLDMGEFRRYERRRRR